MTYTIRIQAGTRLYSDTIDVADDAPQWQHEVSVRTRTTQMLDRILRDRADEHREGE